MLIFTLYHSQASVSKRQLLFIQTFVLGTVSKGEIFCIYSDKSYRVLHSSTVSIGQSHSKSERGPLQPHLWWRRGCCCQGVVFTCRHALPRRQSIQEALLQGLGKWGHGWASEPRRGCRWLRRGQTGSLPGLRGGSRLGERSGQRGRGRKGVRRPQWGLPRRGWGHLPWRAGQSIRGGGARRCGGQADR